jgi:hypothetical protein
MKSADAIAVADIVLRALRAMEDEADTISCGLRSGLRDYATHCGSAKSERSWSAGLARHLSDFGMSSETECPYPKSRKKCDVVATTPKGERVWLEVKAAWKAYFVDSPVITRNQRAFYQGYLFGPLRPGLARSHSAAQDIDKLEKLSIHHASFVALVLIGFDETNGTIECDLSEFAKLAGLRRRGWRIAGPAIWSDRNGDACRTCCWVLWRRPVSKSRRK